MPHAHNGSVQLAYELSGPVNAPALLLIMGIDMNSAQFGAHFIESLSQDHRVIRFDNRGTGASTRKLESLSAADWVADALAVLDAAEVGSARVLGYSMGGRIAQELAVNHADRVERLMLLSSVLGGRDGVMPGAEIFAAIMPTGPVSDPRAFRSSSLQAIAGPGFATREPERFEELLTLGLRSPTHPMVTAKQLGCAGTNVLEGLGRLDIPVAILHGQGDPLVPVANAERLAAALPAARFETLEGIGHLPTWEAPERVLAFARDFFGAA